ncbi:AraC family transcriptional regulator [Mediterraneibacter agrestimuris]|uniref:AraC family transcriptional regulator n=1 Tax=Mediterraneibacter agrestimuris TaxID=2941333 RepID=UPI00203E3F84|nr:AraC family transcriptional regulator [Mediterraneibacter agrestimuris]
MKPGLFYLFPNENFLDLNPYQAGYADNDGAASFGPCTRNHYLFHYVISGAGTLMTEDEMKCERHFHIHTGQGFLIFPGQVTTYWADKNHPWEYVWIEFDGVYASEVISMAGFSVDSPIWKSSDKILARKLCETMMALASPAEGTHFYKQSRLYDFADCLIRATEKPVTILSSNGSFSDYYLQTAFLYIEKNFMNNISVESIAAKCNIHRNKLLKIFKERIGQGPQEYLIKYRMSRAAQLLITTNFSINEIGNAVGYENQLHFSRTFKNVYGMSPKYFREQKISKKYS